MSLVGMATLVVAGLGVLLCSVGLLMAWDRLAALGRARWPVRALWLGCCQLTAVLLVGLVVNHAFVFYQSWSELFGMHPQVNQGQGTAGARDLALRPTLLHGYLTGHGTLVSLPIAGAVERGAHRPGDGVPAAAVRCARATPVVAFRWWSCCPAFPAGRGPGCTCCTWAACWTP